MNVKYENGMREGERNGISFFRTSPDHGTAFDIAGKGKTSPQSMIKAIKLAFRLSPSLQLGSHLPLAVSLPYRLPLLVNLLSPRQGDLDLDLSLIVNQNFCRNQGYSFLSCLPCQAFYLSAVNKKLLLPSGVMVEPAGRLISTDMTIEGKTSPPLISA